MLSERRKLRDQIVSLSTSVDEKEKQIEDLLAEQKNLKAQLDSKSKLVQTFQVCYKFDLTLILGCNCIWRDCRTSKCHVEFNFNSEPR